MEHATTGKVTPGIKSTPDTCIILPQKQKQLSKLHLSVPEKNVLMNSNPFRMHNAAHDMYGHEVLRNRMDT
jgi:hypothetical protein